MEPVRRFRAGTIHEAITLAKQELGEDALIVDVRRIALQGPGETRRGGVEITALPGSRTTRPDGYDGVPHVMPRIDELAAYRPPSVGETGPLAPRTTSRRSTTNRPSHPARQLSVYLRELGIRPPLLDQLTEIWLAGPTLDQRTAMKRAIGDAVMFEDELETGNGRIVAAFVGPTGVGKTTTIAKLAAILSRVRRRRVVVITTDTIRAGGIAQLWTSMQILQVPFYAAHNRTDLQRILQATASAEVVLIDTPGCNPYNTTMLKDLRDLIGTRDPIACYLTLAMTSDSRDLTNAGQRFSLLNPTNLIVTKIDETMRSAGIVGLADQLRLPLSYVCTGPQVPDDIAKATPGLLADVVLQTLENRRPRRVAM